MREPLAWREDLEWVRLESPMVWCWRCHEMKPRGDFPPSTLTPVGTGQCNRCHRVMTLSWQARNPEKTRNMQRRATKKWLEQNRDKNNAKQRARYASDPEYRARIVVRNVAWVKANREKRNAYSREYYRRKKAEKEQP